jgi:hypothetical protein
MSNKGGTVHVQTRGLYFQRRVQYAFNFLGLPKLTYRQNNKFVTWYRNSEPNDGFASEQTQLLTRSSEITRAVTKDDIWNIQKGCKTEL